MRKARQPAGAGPPRTQSLAGTRMPSGQARKPVRVPTGPSRTSILVDNPDRYLARPARRANIGLATSSQRGSGRRGCRRPARTPATPVMPAGRLSRRAGMRDKWTTKRRIRVRACAAGFATTGPWREVRAKPLRFQRDAMIWCGEPNLRDSPCAQGNMAPHRAALCGLQRVIHGVIRARGRPQKRNGPDGGQVCRPNPDQAVCSTPGPCQGCRGRRKVANDNGRLR